MKKKIVINGTNLTREGKLFPSTDPTASKTGKFVPVNNVQIEKLNGYWKVTKKK